MPIRLKINAYGHVVLDVDDEPLVIVPTLEISNPEPLSAPGDAPERPIPQQPARQGPGTPPPLPQLPILPQLRILPPLPVLPRVAVIVYGPQTVEAVAGLEVLPNELTGQLVRTYAPRVRMQRLGYFGGEPAYDFALRPRTDYDILQAVRRARDADVRLQLWTPVLPDFWK